MIDFTVAICTYNGEKRLPEVLNKLRECCAYTTQLESETKPPAWEIIVIDNNSTDNTANVVKDYQADWPSSYPLKYCFEPQQGQAFARKRAILEAEGEFVGFLDDDNLPTPEWIVAAYSFGKEHPKAGAYGGQIHGDFEVNPPAEIKSIVTYYLAIVERGAKAHQYTERGVLPPGAGMVVRKQAWCENVPKKIFFTGRVGKSLMACEDLEVLSYIQNAGWEIWYNPQMHMDHKVPRTRLERDYLISLVRGNGLAKNRIRMLRMKPWQRPLAFPVYMLNDLGQIIFKSIKYRNVIKTDIAAACEIELLKASLISPFYLFKRNF